MPLKTLSYTFKGLEGYQSISPPQYFYPVVVGENFYGLSPKAQAVVETYCRGINVKVDLNDTVGNRTITYRAINGEDLDYVINYSGIHYLAMCGISVIGSAIEAGSLQWFN